MPFDFTGKRVIVAGGSRGIGRSIALGFAAAGAGVSICARGAEALAAAREEIARFGGAAHAASCDLADGAAIARYIAEAAKALGGGTAKNRDVVQGGVHLLVPDAWTVAQAHQLSEEIEARIREMVPHASVDTHIEPISDPASYEDQGLDR